MGRVWIYIISKNLTDSELQSLQQAGQNFVSKWTAHDLQLHASFEIFKKRIIIVKVNESLQSASGCSTDKLSRFIKDCESLFNIELYNRLLVAVKNNEEVQVIHSSQIPELLSKEIINNETLVYNTSAADWEQLNNWEQKISDTWLKKYLINK
ncbi:MAG: hypothetical protein IPM51_02345 [Sphingobacteriaceae bacterium]|nr:hypothetical protein [Sphingobacteriaceae bacterium]